MLKIFLNKKSYFVLFSRKTLKVHAALIFGGNLDKLIPQTHALTYCKCLEYMGVLVL
jgi:hypothetical protein